MEEVRRQEVSAEEVGYPLFDFTARFSRAVESAADQIVAKNPDPRIRRNALLWKLNAVPASFLALEHADPAAMVIDLWAFCLQMTEYLESGAGRELFGDRQPVGIAAARGLEAEIGALTARIVKEEALPVLEQTIEEWAREHPLQDIHFARTSILSLQARLMDVQPAGLFQTVNTVAGQVADLKGRLALYADQLPRQARWQAELLTEEVFVRIVGAQITNAFALISAEREAVLESIERQRLETLEMLQSERERILERVSAEREAVLGRTAELADQVLGQVDGMLADQVVSLTNHVQRQRLDTLEFIRSERMVLTRDAEQIALAAVREVYSRLWLVLAAIWLGTAALLVVARRLFRQNPSSGGDAK